MRNFKFVILVGFMLLAANIACEVPESTPKPVREILFQDDFSDAESGWEVGKYDTGSVGYGAGGQNYVVTSDSKGDWMWGIAGQSFSNVVIEVDAIMVAGPSNDNAGFGIGCNLAADDSGDGYYLAVSGDGYYSITKVADSAPEVIVDWSTSSAINEGNETNALKAVCANGELELHVNGRRVARVSDDTYLSGDIALFSIPFEDETIEAQFDNLVVSRFTE